MIAIAGCATGLSATGSADSRPGATPIVEWIRIDQFGYPIDAPKVAVVSLPVIGFNAPGTYAPGDRFELRRVSDHRLVWSGTADRWNYGQLHAQSGDRGWWIDFSEVQQPGTYYLLDAANNVRSYDIRIGDDVYDDVLVAAVRTFFYQRLNAAKAPPYVDPAWADDPAYDGPGQDREARSRYAKDDPSTARDVHGGWMDAGDPNKYTTFAESAVIGLLRTWEARPDLFGDDTGIPESGNGVPDLLDEVRFQLEFLGRMQDATGTGGLFLKVGVDNHDAVTPLSLDRRPRFYVPECTSATLSGAAMFAKAAIVYAELEQTRGFADEMLVRAIHAWDRAVVTTRDFTLFGTDCDDQDITSGDADRSVVEQVESALQAAIFLFEATGAVRFRDFIDARFADSRPIWNAQWGPYTRGIVVALLRYAGLPHATRDVAERILTGRSRSMRAATIDAADAGTDLYRAHLDSNAHHWGSNSIRSHAGSLALDVIAHRLDPGHDDRYRDAAYGYLMWLHGTNPLGLVMLSNMYDYGAASSVNEFYHTWFADGSPWDNARTSRFGPPPGYLVGGPNRGYTGPLSPPAGQPPQKSYLDWNAGWPENSWEITENAIYYQAAYIELLARLMPRRDR
ncbi:MAG: glycoside hydrolase family 9 [Spirochaetaceae bacterium]|nr:MAG: glycoside hydrolase family 9 [Spirochaetaceae bacterium]